MAQTIRARPLRAESTARRRVEPEPDDSPAPFFFKPLVDEQIEDTGDHGVQELENRADEFPTGEVALAQ